MIGNRVVTSHKYIAVSNISVAGTFNIRDSAEQYKRLLGRQLAFSVCNEYAIRQYPEWDYKRLYTVRPSTGLIVTDTALFWPEKLYITSGLVSSFIKPYGIWRSKFFSKSNTYVYPKELFVQIELPYTYEDDFLSIDNVSPYSELLNL